MIVPSKKIIFLFFLSVFFAPASAFAFVPDDPFAEQWAYEKIGAYRAWDITTGSNDIVVAIIDNGFDANHPDLAPNVWVNVDEIPDNGIDDDANGYIDDVYGWDFVSKDRNGDGERSAQERKGDNNPVPGSDEVDLGDDKERIHHGTVVAGLIGGVGDNRLYGAGIAWDIQLMNLRYIDNDGIGSFARLDEAIRYAVDNGAHIINLSLVGPEWSAKLSEAVDYAYDNNVLIVAAAGNDRLDMTEDERYPVCADASEEGEKEKVIGVSAIMENRRLAPFSNIGFSCIDIAAPGVNLSSTLLYAPDDDYEEAYGENWNGTSFAAPLVSGVAALVKSIQPTWSVDQLVNALTKSTSVTPGSDPDLYQTFFGSGLIQADKAVAYALSEDGALDPTYLSLISELFAIYDNGHVGPLTDNQDFFQNVSSMNRVDDATSYKDGNNHRFVTTHFNEQEGLVTISFFDSEWLLVRSWTVESNGPLDVVVGDVTGSSNEEVVLVPTTRSTVIAYVYNKFGRIVKELTQESVHEGATVALGSVQEDGKSPMYILLTDSNAGYDVYQYNADLDVEKRLELVFPASEVPSLAVGSFKDGEEDRIVIGAPANSLPYLGIYQIDGTFVNTFFSDSPIMTSGVDVAIRGGFLVSVPETTGRPLGVWNQDGVRRGESLVLPENVGSGATRLFVVSK